MHTVDPSAGKITKRGEVFLGGQNLRLEAPHLAGRCRPPLDGMTANNPTHGGIACRHFHHHIADEMLPDSSLFEHCSFASAVIPCYLLRRVDRQASRRKRSAAMIASGSQIRAARAGLEWSQAELAGRAGIHAKAVA